MTTQTQVRSTEEALKLALEALIGARAFLESDTPVEIWSLNDKAITAIKEALAQPEQEPVAWLIEYEACAGGMNRGSSLKKFDYVWHECSFVSEDKDAEIESIKWRNRKETPLYTTPPQRKPLDIKTIKRIATYCGEHITDEDVIEITRRVEEEHKIKE